MDWDIESWDSRKLNEENTFSASDLELDIESRDSSKLNVRRTKITRLKATRMGGFLSCKLQAATEFASLEVNSSKDFPKSPINAGLFADD